MKFLSVLMLCVAVATAVNLPERDQVVVVATAEVGEHINLPKGDQVVVVASADAGEQNDVSTGDQVVVVATAEADEHINLLKGDQVAMVASADAGEQNDVSKGDQVVVVATAEADEHINLPEGDLVAVVASADADSFFQQEVDSRSILINALVRQLINYLRRIINEGSLIFGIPRLDPLELDHLEIKIPAGLINLGLALEDVYATGFGPFVVHKSDLNLREMTFDVDVSFPQILARASSYDFLGDLFTAVPLYGKGDVLFDIQGFRFQARLNLMQSDNERSILIRSIEDAAYQVPHFKSHLTGAIGGGEIDKIVNAIIEDVIVGYVNRFSNVIAPVAANVIQNFLNPILNNLDTWRYIAPLL